MIIYHGAINKDIQLVTDEKLHCLVTYAAYKKHIWQPWWKNLFIDSGAFSVHNSGKTIDIEKYIEYLLEWESMSKKIVYASLDVIGDAKEGMKNYKYLLKKKLNPIPTYHYGESIEVLKELVELRQSKDHARNINTNKLCQTTLDIVKNWAKKYGIDWDNMINNEDEKYRSNARIYLSIKSLEEITTTNDIYKSKYSSLLDI